MQFSEFGLDPRLNKTIEHLGFTEATEIQTRAIPAAMAGKDLLASSKTGSGKTLAYLLPAMQRMLKTRALSKRDARMLILTPTRELAKQVFAQLRLLIANTQTRACLITGGENFNDQSKLLRKDPQVVVATPGRLADHLSKRHLFLEGLELLILDEADRMLDLGFAEQLKIVDKAANHRKRQTLMFSATLDDAAINQFALNLLKAPERIAVGFSFTQHQDIQQQFLLSDHLDHKQLQLAEILKQDSVKQAIVFTATRADTQRLAEAFGEQGLSCSALNADLSQGARNKIMDDFSRGHQKVLFTTDLASRGLDIVQVSHVINFDMPKHVEEYVHRIGRTGRAGNQGLAYSLVGPKDWHSFKSLEALLEQKVAFITLDGLAAKFKGLRAPSNKASFSKKPQKASPKKTAKVGKAKVKSNKTFAVGTDMGDAPIVRQKKAINPSDIDSNDNEA
ncbi:DEAD/DEAH box helicase [Agarivorans sp. 1_MG-2023]|uniref:DEAD/DEAH box helicase n=1 Tax=Agarivorans sp. 1_MG-2023 TaxID=3062634 RepID=UPI0026E2B870|nr:DEAD/DEAH box helicase [Agarivorans sp. 1_MG-2023]MDO6762510.1 DEAD/DEAH box helicase [Agarivorans sp. 1_MG-2023]